MNKVLIALSITVIAIIVYFAVAKSDSKVTQPAIDMASAPADLSMIEQPSTQHRANNNPNASTAHSSAEAVTDDLDPLMDTKSNLDIQPIDPETDPANQVVQP